MICSCLPQNLFDIRILSDWNIIRCWARANSWEPPGSISSLISGRKIDSSLKIARLFADNTMQAKYLETKQHAVSREPRGGPEGGSREGEGCHHPGAVSRIASDIVAIRTFYILTKKLSNGISGPLDGGFINYPDLLSG